MTVQEIIIKEFERYISDTFMGKPDILAFFANHERKQLCIDGLCEEVRKAELSNIGRMMDLDRVKFFAHSGAEMFCQLALTSAEEQAVSAAEYQRRLDVNLVYERAEEAITDLENEAKDERIKSYPIKE